MPAVLEVRGLSIELGTPTGPLKAVRDIDFYVNEGEVLGIVGESGCGKSLAMMGVMDLLPKSTTNRSGEILLMGKDLTQASAAEMRKIRGNEVGMIFQDPMSALNPAYKIGNQLVEGYLSHRGSSYKEAEERAVYLLNRVGITAAKSRLAQYPHQLSGGLRQRVLIALALMCEPKLIIADEPTTALDVTIQAQILRLLKDVQEEYEASVVFISHDLGVISQLADRVAVMYSGEVIETGSVADVFRNPRHPYTRGLLSCIPAPGHEGRLGQIRGMVPSLIGDFSGCVFRTRCDFAASQCRNKVPVHDDGGSHVWRCVHETLPQTTGTGSPS